MKKTIIAAAIAAVAAAPAAMADVSIYGMAHMDLSDDTLNDRASRIGFKGTEDLGNGMTASFTYETQVDFQNAFGASTDDAGTKASTAFKNGRHAHVSVGGDFGTVTAGYVYMPTKGLFGFSKTEINGDGVADNSAYLMAEPKGEAVQYTGKIGGATVKLACAGTELCDDTDMSVTTALGSVNLGLGLYSVDGGEDTTTIAANTKVGDLTLGAIYQDNDSGDATIVSAAYSMGANTIKVSMADKGAAESTNVMVSHALSKATSLYVAMDDENDDTAVGLIHKF
jgi:predicted porin